MVKDNNYFWLWVFVPFFIMFVIISLPFFLPEDNRPDCSSPIIKTCYRGISTGGIFGGYSYIETSCSNPHDYYINMSEPPYINCKFIMVKGYD